METTEKLDQDALAVMDALNEMATFRPGTITGHNFDHDGERRTQFYLVVSRTAKTATFRRVRSLGGNGWDTTGNPNFRVLLKRNETLKSEYFSMKYCEDTYATTVFGHYLVEAN